MRKRSDVFTNALAALAAGAVLASLTAVPATAATVAESPPQATAAAAAAPESTLEDKVRAAAVLGIVAGDDLLILNDRNFVIALWRKAAGAEVRASAELAFAGTELECTQWIKTGIHEAKRRDDTKEIQDAEVARQARELKQRAAATIGVVAEPEVLVQSYKDFVFALWQRATGPKVKAAALTAFGADEAAQKEFLLTGIGTAHAQDQQDAIDADKEATEAEKARLAARNAKANAAAVLGIVATEGLLVLSNDNFVREIWNRAVAGSEVAVAAERALRSSNPADWKTYIDTGIYAANKRDLEIALQRKTEADRKRLQELKVRAENSGVHPMLAWAAGNALAGDHQVVDRFLRIGQYEDSVLHQALQADTEGVRGAYVRGPQGGQALIAFGNPAPQPGEGADATWKVVPGLADFGCHSFESVTKPGSYLRQLDFKILIVPSDGTERFRTDATWCSRTEPGGVTLEAKGAPGRFLRHHNGRLWAANGSGTHVFDAPANYGIDRLWRVHGGNPSTSAIQRRWLNDNDVRVRIGDPVADEKTEGTIRYRDYRNGRLTWTATIGVKHMEGHIYGKYITEDGLHHRAFGAPTTDETATPDKIGRFNHFAGGGSIYWTVTTGPHLIYGGIKGRWKDLGWEGSYLGYPTSSEMDVPGGRCSNFQHGSIFYNSDTGVSSDRSTPCRP
ncbi:AbfB domain-containing protein [Amycolatopsis sp. cmx-11-12]|uniref:AbfB domain-containing protein n=1 Tax=Amycolatopsis sp. cmx-11-12 TaxID=2785795 RepID=UPI003917DCB3